MKTEKKFNWNKGQIKGFIKNDTQDDLIVLLLLLFLSHL